jgi:hypothetical protein
MGVPPSQGNLTVLLQNLGEGENDSRNSGSLAKSSDAYFRFGYRNSKVDQGIRNTQQCHEALKRRPIKTESMY